MQFKKLESINYVDNNGVNHRYLNMDNETMDEINQAIKNGKITMILKFKGVLQ